VLNLKLRYVKQEMRIDILADNQLGRSITKLEECFYKDRGNMFSRNFALSLRTAWRYNPKDCTLCGNKSRTLEVDRTGSRMCEKLDFRISSFEPFCFRSMSEKILPSKIM
jgi:hypothetical protein